MKTLLLSFMQQRIADGLTFRASEARQAAVVGRYQSGTTSSGISQALCLWEPPCWGTCRRLMRITLFPRLAFTAIVLEAVLRTYQALIAGP